MPYLTLHWYVLALFTQMKQCVFFKPSIVVPDVVFIDINMPGLTGDTCLRAIWNSKLYDDVYIAMYSTSMTEEVSDALKRLGANITFEKPARMAKYSEIVSGMLDQVMD